MTLSIHADADDPARRPVDHGVGSGKIGRATLEAGSGERAGDRT
ncbi:hypothetical protein SAMN05444422_103320 [Halobiforma haloterrestris]|uniref:Uncharacterized protein n=1 Tax=Natronobacterium haloterrestre TaxID=148448 RepID=A0A1I1FE58_NATHA|nr:hypothetical protein [Halobiforma haloterrestris]SFB97769.1 hypothetical protein SAMN05444422_103320 [Halobiforma haloterrestris]